MTEHTRSQFRPLPTVRSQYSRSHRGGGGGLGGGGTKHSGHVAQARLVKAHCSSQLEPNAFVDGLEPPPHAQHMRLAVKSSSSSDIKRGHAPPAGSSS